MSIQQEIREIENTIIRLQKEEQEAQKKDAPPTTVVENPNKLPASRKKIDKTEAEDENEKDNGKVKPNIENGGAVVGGYPAKWTQTVTELEIFVDLPPHKSVRSLYVDSTPYKLKIGYKDEEAMIEGDLFEPVKSAETFWNVDEGILHVQMVKLHGMRWWSRILDGDPSINTRMCEPGESRADDLDPSLRSEVDKMLWKQKQKEKGITEPVDEKKKKILEEFQQKHPEMDFSKATMAPGS